MDQVSFDEDDVWRCLVGSLRKDDVSGNICHAMTQNTAWSAINDNKEQLLYIKDRIGLCHSGLRMPMRCREPIVLHMTLLYIICQYDSSRPRHNLPVIYILKFSILKVYWKFLKSSTKSFAMSSSDFAVAFPTVYPMPIG